MGNGHINLVESFALITGSLIDWEENLHEKNLFALKRDLAHTDTAMCMVVLSISNFYVL